MDRFFEALTRWIERALAAALVFSVALNFANVVGRYGLARSILWADEAQIFLMIWIAFLGAVVATWRNAHLRMDMLFRAFPRAARRLVRLAEALTLAVLAGVVVFQSGQYANNMFALERLSDVARVPMWIPHSGIALGFALILLIALLRLWRLARKELRAGEEGAR